MFYCLDRGLGGVLAFIVLRFLSLFVLTEDVCLISPALVCVEFPVKFFVSVSANTTNCVFKIFLLVKTPRCIGETTEQCDYLKMVILLFCIGKF